MNSELTKTINSFDINTISDDRKKQLNNLIEFIRVRGQEKVKLNFICTHNSRRSHLCQVWAQTMASLYGLTNVTSYSGGTEATAIYPQILSTLDEQGFSIVSLSSGVNPVVALKYSETENPIIAFSKKYDHPFNPVEDYAAIMVCSDAEQNCPMIPGRVSRIGITYQDPKVSDGTPQMQTIYLERSIEIGTEMKYVFLNV